MPYCEKCNALLNEEECFCSYCGSEQNLDRIKYVEVTLVGGFKRKLYLYKGEYYNDKNLRNKYSFNNLIESDPKEIKENKKMEVKFLFFIK